MKIRVNKLALVSILALTACSGWFDENEPLPSELSGRPPLLNSTTPASFPDPVNGTYSNLPIDTMMPPAPEPPAFIGSTGVQPAATIPVQQSSLPMMSPVDMSGANNSATGLPVQRRAPAFNQSLGIVPEGKAAEFPKLAQIPPAPTAPISAEIDSRVTQMKADLQANKRQVVAIAPTTPAVPAFPQSAPIRPETVPNNLPKITPITPKVANVAPIKPVMAEAPVAPIAPITLPTEKVRPIAKAEGPSTNFANLKPLPNEPIYKIAEEPKVIGAQPRVLNTQGPGSMERAQNTTRLSDLRPIGNRGTGYGKIRKSTPAGGKANMGIARHSTYYGEY